MIILKKDCDLIIVSLCSSLTNVKLICYAIKHTCYASALPALVAIALSELDCHD